RRRGARGQVETLTIGGRVGASPTSAGSSVRRYVGWPLTLPTSTDAAPSRTRNGWPTAVGRSGALASRRQTTYTRPLAGEFIPASAKRASPSQTSSLPVEPAAAPDAASTVAGCVVQWGPESLATM